MLLVRACLPRYVFPMSSDRDLGILNALAQALSRSLDLEQVLYTALDKVAELLELEPAIGDCAAAQIQVSE